MTSTPTTPHERAWDDDHPVLAELRRRRRAASTPATRRAAGEQTRIGLAVEGGGMRGVVSAAMLCALEDLGLTPAFDAVYGLSSGAINAAYFLTGDCWLPLSIYYDDLATRQFIDFTRPFRGQSIIDLDYAFDEVIDLRKPLDYDRVRSSAVALHIGITDVDATKPVVVDAFESAADVKAALRAGSWLPGAVQGTAEFRGVRAIDGGVLTAHPSALAVDDGCTHVLSLSTHRIDAPRRFNPVALRYAYRYLERLGAGLGDGYLESLRDEGRRRTWRLTSMIRPTPGPYVLDLGPLAASPVVKRHEMDRAALIEAARHGYETMFSAVERRPVAAGGDTTVRAVPRFVVVDRGPGGGAIRRA